MKPWIAALAAMKNAEGYAGLRKESTENKEDSLGAVKESLVGTTDYVEVFQRSAGVEQHDGFVRLDGAGGDEPLDRHPCGAALGRRADALVLPDRQHPVHHRRIVHGDSGAAAFADRAQDQKVPNRARD